MSLRGEAAWASRTRPAWSSVVRLRISAFVLVIAALGSAVDLGAPVTLHAQAEEGWVGKRVVQKYDSFKLGLGGQGVVPKLIHTYRVEKVNGAVL